MMIDVSNAGTVSLCDKCAEPLYAGPDEPERLTGFGPCALCGEKDWRNGKWTGRVHYYRPRTVAKMIPQQFTYKPRESAAVVLLKTENVWPSKARIPK